LSLCANRASIDVHVKAPDNGGCGPLPELRLAGDAVWGASGLRVPRSERTATVSRELRFPAAFAGTAFGSGCSRAAAFGSEIGRLGRLFGDAAGRRDVFFDVRGRRASSEAVRPAPKAGLPCRSRFRFGRCRSIFGQALSGDGGFPSPCREVRQSGTAQLLARLCEVSSAKEGSCAELSPARSVAAQAAASWRPYDGGCASRRLPVRKRSFGVSSAPRSDFYDLCEACLPRRK